MSDAVTAARSNCVLWRIVALRIGIDYGMGVNLAKLPELLREP
jgi:hypothetical protein